MKLRLAQPALALLAGVSVAALLSLTAPAVAALPPANGASSNAAVTQLVRDAQKAIKAGKLPLAVIDLKNASSADPHNGPVRAQLGVVLLQTGDYYAAERELRQARKDGAPDQLVLPPLFSTMLARNEEKILLDEFSETGGPPNMTADILKARALAFLDLGQSADAIDAMDKSLKLRRDVPGLLLRARIAAKSGAIASGMQFTDQAIALAPNNADGPLLKVSLLLDSNDLNGALTLADQIVAKFPANMPAQFSRLEVLMRLNRNDEAKRALDAVLAKDPGIAIGLYYRALLLSRAGDNKAAWRIAQTLPDEFLRSQPRASLAVSQMADAAGSSETAAAILNAAIGRFPQDQQLRLKLAQLRVKQNDINGAVNALEALGDRIDPVTAQTLTALYVRSGRAGKALAVLEKLVQSGRGTDATTLQLAALEMQMNQPDQALKDLTTAVSQKPNDAVLVNQLMLALIARGRFEDALSVADKLGADPAQRVASLTLRARVFLAENKLDDALASYAKAIALDPRSQMALFGHADILERMRRFDDAVKDIHAILDLDPQSTVGYLKLAEIAAQQNQDGQVRSALTQAIKQSPSDPSPRLSLARYLIVRNDRAGALAMLSDLLKIHPDNADGLRLLGADQLAMGKRDDAIATFRRLAALAPNAAGSQILLGSALFAKGDQTGANAALKKAVDLAPASPDVRLANIDLMFAEKDTGAAIASAQAYQNAYAGPQGDILLGDTLVRAGRRDQAMAVYKKSFSANPSGGLLLRMTKNYMAGGDSKSAAEALSSWVDKNPADATIRMEYGIILMQQGNNDGAIRQFREVLKSQPGNIASLNNLAWLTRDEDPGNAIAMASRAAALAPNSSDVLDTLGWIKLKHGKAAESLPLFQRAHALRPQDGEISYHLALSLDASGSHNAARGFLKALVSSHVKFADQAEADRLAQSWH